MKDGLWFGARFDYGRVLIDHPDAAGCVGEIMTRSSFAVLRRIGQRRGDRWLRHTNINRGVAKEYLLDRTTEAVAFDNGRTKELIASAQFEHGPYPTQARGPEATRFYAYVAWPAPSDVDACVMDVAELVHALEATAGFVAVEPSHSRAQETALGGRLPRERAGLSDQRRRERRGRGWKSREMASRVSGVEWLTVLGAAHLTTLASAGVSVETLRTSDAFHRVLEVVPNRIVLLQITDSPVDDVRADSFEMKLENARSVLAPVLLDVSDVDLEPTA